jgi:hypothetical protein
MMDIAESIKTNCDAPLSMHSQMSSVPFDSPPLTLLQDGRLSGEQVDEKHDYKICKIEM